MDTTQTVNVDIHNCCDVVEKFINGKVSFNPHHHHVLCTCSDWNAFMEGYIRFRSLQFNKTHLKAAPQQWVVKLSHQIGYNFNPTPVRVIYHLAQAIQWYNKLNVPKPFDD